MTTTARRRGAVVALILCLAILGVWLLWPSPERSATGPTIVDPPPPAAQNVLKGTVLKSAACQRNATQPFVPSRITVPGVTRNAAVFGLPRDPHNVPSAISVSSSNAKTSFAWDAPTIKPGEPQGNVLLNAHTWPDGTALGNKLLAGLYVGDRIIVRGTGGEELCYRVTKRVVIRAADGSAEYYVKDGPPQLALIVCSAPRLGPGNWQNRTIWYAAPVGSAA